MELIIGFVIAVILLLLAAQDERLGEDNERAWINHLADESRRKGHAGTRRRCRYIQAGYRPGKTRRAL